MTAFCERLNEIALQLDSDAAASGDFAFYLESMRDAASDLCKLANELEDIERLAPPDDGFPNPRQSLALGRFLNQAMRDDQFQARPHDAHAAVSRSRLGVGGISENYLGVRFADGYEGGIDREGRVST